MASSMVEIGLTLVLMTTHWVGTMAQSGCSNVLIGMAPCLNYVTGSSTTPSSSCCSSLASVVKSQPQCLCSALNGGGAALGISINETLALSLPAACKVQTPPVSRCNDANNAPTPSNAPAPSPVGLSPVGSPESSQADVPSSMSGSNTVPGNSGSSDATGSNAVLGNSGSSDATNTGSKTVPRNGESSDAISTMMIGHNLFIGVLIVISFATAFNSV